MKGRLRDTYGQTSFNAADDVMSSFQDLVLKPIAHESGEVMLRQTFQSEFEKLNALNNT